MYVYFMRSQHDFDNFLAPLSIQRQPRRRCRRRFRRRQHHRLGP